LYLTVEDTTGRSATVVTDSPEATTVDYWNEWTILLSDLSAAGVNASGVKKLTIGVSDKAKPKPGGGTGLIYMDDIGFGRPIPHVGTRPG
jgi:hypothetical protein